MITTAIVAAYLLAGVPAAAWFSAITIIRMKDDDGRHLRPMAIEFGIVTVALLWPVVALAILAVEIVINVSKLYEWWRDR